MIWIIFNQGRVGFKNLKMLVKKVHMKVGEKDKFNLTIRT
jgi:hypothetical protein